MTSIQEEEPTLWLTHSVCIILSCLREKHSGIYCSFQNFRPPSQMPPSSVPSIRGYGKQKSVNHAALHACFSRVNSTSVILLLSFFFPLPSLLPSFFLSFCKAPNYSWTHIVLDNNCLSSLLPCPENTVQCPSSSAPCGVIVTSGEMGYFSRETYWASSPHFTSPAPPYHRPQHLPT